MTLPRTLEPEVMDTAELALAYNDMDHEEVNRRFVDDLLAVGDWGPDILDLGTGTALIPVELCRRVDDCRLMAADAAIHMLDMARLNIEIAGLIDRIQLDHVDAKKLHYADAYFDVVISNSLIHHIAEPLGVLREAVRVLRPGGLLFFRDLVRPDSEQKVRHLVETYAGSETEQQQQMLAESLRAALTVDEMRSLVAELGFSPDGVQMTSDRHWTWIGRLPAKEEERLGEGPGVEDSEAI